MTNLILATNPITGFSAYIDQATGGAYISDTLICSLTGMDNKSLAGIIQSEGVGNFASEATQILRETGFVTVGNLRQSADISTILFAWNPTKIVNKERKEKLIKSLIDAGATAYIYSLCGYTMQPDSGFTSLPTSRDPARKILKPTPSEIKEFSDLFSHLFDEKFGQEYALAEVDRHYPQITIPQIESQIIPESHEDAYLIPSEKMKDFHQKSRLELFDWIDNLDIVVPTFTIENLIKESCSHYNELWESRGSQEKCASEDDNPEFLARICQNFLRHECSDYEFLLEKMSGKSGCIDGYPRLKSRINNAIALKYPRLQSKINKRSR